MFQNISRFRTVVLHDQRTTITTDERIKEMIPFHKLVYLIMGFAMVHLCRFFYAGYYNRGPSYTRLTTSTPSYSAQERQILGLSPSQQYPGMYQLGNQNLYLTNNRFYQQDQGGTLYLDPLGTGTRFKEYTGDVKGFIRPDDNTYKASQAYISAMLAAQNAPTQVGGTRIGNVGLYRPATGLTAPTVSGPSYGAGRFLSGGLLGSPIQFGTPSGKTAGE